MHRAGLLFQKVYLYREGVLVVLLAKAWASNQELAGQASPRVVSVGLFFSKTLFIPFALHGVVHPKR